MAASFGHGFLLTGNQAHGSFSTSSRPRSSTMAASTSRTSSYTSPRTTPIEEFTTIPSIAEAAAASNSSLHLPLTDSSGRRTSSPSPDLGHEVAALSNKLIKAINHQTALEEGLEDTRHELDVSKTRIKELEKIAKEHADMMAKGLLVEKKEVEMETMTLMNKLMEESVQRVTAEKEKKNIEQDLENLTSSLFEEANKMVIAARKEREAVIRRNDQLEQQLQDTETLLITHQEQLSELKMALQQMTAEREEMEAMSTPSTPALNSAASRDSLNRIYEALHLPDEISPSHPTSFSHLLQPVLRSDISSYNDFVAVIRIQKNYSNAPAPAPAPTSMGSFSMNTLTNLIGNSPKHSRTPSASSSFFGHNPSRSVSSVQSNGSNGSLPNTPTPVLQPAPLLKDTAFFKRALMEDIEPTLRLDSAPGLSWLARRTVLNSIIDGSLVIEAMPSTSKLSSTACTLCGEARQDVSHARTHRFRTNETAAAQRYPMCPYCAARLRSVCDFMQFLRTVKEGHWKCETEEDEKNAWEESVKLREGMFWSRVGGGVVPAFASTVVNSVKSARSSTEDTERSAGGGSASTSATEVVGDEAAVIVDGGVGLGVVETAKQATMVKMVTVGKRPPPLPARSSMRTERDEAGRPGSPLKSPSIMVPVAAPLKSPTPMNRPTLPPREAPLSPRRVLQAEEIMATTEEEDEDFDEDDEDEDVEDEEKTTEKEKEKVQVEKEEKEETPRKKDRDSQLPSPPDSPALKMSEMREELRSPSPEMPGGFP